MEGGMTEVVIWALAAIFFAVACVAVWFFLKLFFRLALVIVAVLFLIAFLHHYALLPESLSKRVEELIIKGQEMMQERVEQTKPQQKKKESHTQAEHRRTDTCDIVFC